MSPCPLRGLRTGWALAFFLVLDLGLHDICVSAFDGQVAASQRDFLLELLPKDPVNQDRLGGLSPLLQIRSRSRDTHLHSKFP